MIQLGTLGTLGTPDWFESKKTRSPADEVGTAVKKDITRALSGPEFLTPEQRGQITKLNPGDRDERRPDLEYWDRTGGTYIQDLFIGRDSYGFGSHGESFLGLSIGQWESLFDFLKLTATVKEECGLIIIHLTRSDYENFKKFMSYYFGNDHYTTKCLPSLCRKVLIYETEGNFSGLVGGF